MKTEEQLIAEHRARLLRLQERGLNWKTVASNAWTFGVWGIVSTGQKTILTGESWVFATDKGLGFVASPTRGSINYLMEKFNVRPGHWDRDVAVAECAKEALEAREDGDEKLADAWDRLGEEFESNGDLACPTSAAIVMRDGDFEPITRDGEWHVPGARAPNSFLEAVALMDVFADHYQRLQSEAAARAAQAVSDWDTALGTTQAEDDLNEWLARPEVRQCSEEISRSGRIVGIMESGKMLTAKDGTEWLSVGITVPGAAARNLPLCSRLLLIRNDLPQVKP